MNSLRFWSFHNYLPQQTHTTLQRQLNYTTAPGDILSTQLLLAKYCTSRKYEIFLFFKHFQNETFWRPIHSCRATNFQCNSQNRKIIVAGKTINDHFISYHWPAIIVLDCGVFKALLIRSRPLSSIYSRNEAMNRVNIMTNYRLKTGVKSAFEMSCLTNILKKQTSLVSYWKAYKY